MAGLKDAIIRRLAASHIAGPRIADALAHCRHAAAQGWSSTICPWTSGTTSPDDALTLYLEAVAGRLRTTGLEVHVHVRAGPPGPTIAATAGVLGADLLFVARTASRPQAPGGKRRRRTLPGCAVPGRLRANWHNRRGAGELRHPELWQ